MAIPSDGAALVIGDLDKVARPLLARLFGDGYTVINVGAIPLAGAQNGATLMEVNLPEAGPDAEAMPQAAVEGEPIRLGDHARNGVAAIVASQVLVSVRHAVKDERMIIGIRSCAAPSKEDQIAHSASTTAACGFIPAMVLKHGTDGSNVNTVALAPTAAGCFPQITPPGGGARERIRMGVLARRLSMAKTNVNGVSFLSTCSGSVAGRLLYVCGGTSVRFSR